MGLRRLIGGVGGNHAPAVLRDPPREVKVALGKEPPVTASQHANGGPAGLQGALVGSCVDAYR